MRNGLGKLLPPEAVAQSSRLIAQSSSALDLVLLLLGRVGRRAANGDLARLGSLGLRDGDRQQAVHEVRVDAVGIDELGEPHRALEASVDTLRGEHADLALRR